jgi:hypothetical protein
VLTGSVIGRRKEFGPNFFGKQHCPNWERRHALDKESRCCQTIFPKSARV